MDILKNNIVVGLGVAVAAMALAPLLLPVLGGVGRPLAKSLVKGGMALFEKGRESLALAGESLEDMMAEIRAEATVQAAQHGAHGGDTLRQGDDGTPPMHRPAGAAGVAGAAGTSGANGAAAETAAQSAGTVGL